MTIIVASLIIIVFFPFRSWNLKCYECSGYVPCGSGQTHLLVNCGGKCMVYQNQFDKSKIFKIHLFKDMMNQ